MKRTLRIMLALVMAAALVLPNLAAGAPGIAADSRPHRYVRVAHTAKSGLDSLGIRPLASIDYGAFIWLELSQGDFARLSGQVPYQEATSAGIISLPNTRFDPLVEGEPALTPGLRAREGEAGFRLVQFMGPIKDQWLQQVQRTGAVLLQYYPYNTYLVWATPEQTSRLRGLAPVRWTGLFHTAYRISPALSSATGMIRDVAITFYNDGDAQSTLYAITNLGGLYIQHFSAQPDGKFITALYRLEASRLEDVASLSTVWAVEYSSPKPAFDDENGTQIVAGNYTAGVPYPGYYTWLAEKGVDGGGITWADVDTGLNASHPDVTGRAVAFIQYPGAPAANTDPDGHGSHTAGAIFGDGQGGTGITDPNGFYWGTGVVPEASLVVQNALMGTNWPPTGGWQLLSKDSVLNGAIGSSNSWYTGATGAQGYSAAARTHDLMVRDANFDTTNVAEPIIMVFSAGNAGPGPSTMTEPKEAKNLITVGASDNYPRSGTSINDLAYFSSRGPALDGRLLPNVTAPGVQTSSLNGSGATCGSPVPGPGSTYYNFCQGTSMAAPFVSGSAALIADWWEQQGRGTPSPAMVKSLLINGAADMVGGIDGGGGTIDPIPNNDQGWGRTHLDNVILPSVPVQYFDQETLFQNTGETWQLNASSFDPTQPLKISLVWTDAAGAVNANPALVNDLDLIVTAGGDTYYGNHFSGGWSIPGGTTDDLNNIENVYFEVPPVQAAITVQATNIAADGVPYNGDITDQDFALVCYNCSLGPDFTMEATPEAQPVCAPDTVDYQIALGSSLGFADPVDLSADFTPSSSMMTTFSVDPVIPPGSTVLTVGNTGSAGEGHYDIQVTGTAPTKTHSITVGLDVYAGLAIAPILLTPADGAAGQPVQPAFTWGAAGLPSTYAIQIALDESFTQVVEAASGLTETLYSPAVSLDTAERYYWRVRTDNVCGEGAYSAANSFTTVVLASDCAVDYTPVVGYTQGFESGMGGWTHSGTNDTWALSGVRAYSGTWSMNADDPASTVSDQMLYSPAIAIPATLVSPTLQFWNYQELEKRSGHCYDGGLLEITTDGGASWMQVENGLVTDPYDGPIYSGHGNPLAGQDAWCGNPQPWMNSVVDLSAYAGQMVAFRFHLGSDNSGATNREGWYIDDVVVQSCAVDGYAAKWSGGSTLDGQPGETVTHTFTLNNLGLSDSYTLGISRNSWPTSLVSTSTVALAPGGSMPVQVRVEVPEGVGEAVIASDSFTLTATSQGDPLVRADVQGLTNATATAGVSLAATPAAGSAAPGSTAVYELEVTNTGSYTDTFSLSASGVWTATLPVSSTGELGAGESVVMELEVQVPVGVVIGDSDLTTVTAVSALDGEVTATVPVETRAAYRLIFLPMISND